MLGGLSRGRVVCGVLAGAAVALLLLRRRRRRSLLKGGGVRRVCYGSHPSQYVKLHHEAAAAAAAAAAGQKQPVAVIVHGGFWKNKYTVDNAATETLAPFLVARGWCVAEVEYRRRDDAGGGWDGTPRDIMAALAAIGGDAAFCRAADRSRVVLIGHSAGGHLALYGAHHAVRRAATRAAAPSSALVPSLAVALAPVADLIAAHRARLSDEGDAVQRFMRGRTPEDDPDAYHAASPAESMLPLATPTLLATGADDADVPAHFTETFYDAATRARSAAGVTTGSAAPHDDQPPVELLVVPGADHYDVTNAESAAWSLIFDKIARFVDTGAFR